MFATPRRLLTVRELAQLTGAADRNIYRAIQRGTLPLAEGSDVPSGKKCVEESVGVRWSKSGPQLRRRGKKGGPP